MLRIQGAVALVLALIACAWWFTRGPAPSIAEVAAPRPAVAPAEPSSPAPAEPLRSVVGPDSGRSAALVVEEAPPADAPDQVPAPAPAEDLSALDPYALHFLRARLAEELAASTAAEFKRRHAAGMAVFVGADEGFDVGLAWDPNLVMDLRVVDGATWRVVLPREEFPDAYALLDRKLAVEAEIHSRGK